MTDRTALAPPAPPCQALVCLTNTSAILLWSGLAAAAAYQCRGFPAPFAASLTEQQRELRRSSAGQRRRFFGAAFVASAAVLAAAGARYLRWRADP